QDHRKLKIAGDPFERSQYFLFRQMLRRWRIVSDRLRNHFFDRRYFQPLFSGFSVVNIEKNFVKPGSQVSSNFKSVERTPSLKIGFLDQILSFRPISTHSQRDAKKLAGKAQSFRLENIKSMQLVVLFQPGALSTLNCVLPIREQIFPHSKIYSM